MENGGKDAYFEATSVPRDGNELYEAGKAQAAKNNMKPPPRITKRRGYPVLRPPRKRFDPLEPFGKSYSPLVSTPYLFLEFARIIERKDPDQMIRDWISQYGLLGLQRRESGKFEIDMKVGPRAGAQFEKEYSQRGGEQETLARVFVETSRANRLLVSYEAVLARDVAQLEKIAYEVAREQMYEEALDEHLLLEVSLTGGDYTDVLIDWIITVHILPDVQEVLREYTFPCITHRRTLESDSVLADWDAQAQKHVPRLLEGKSTLWAPDRLIRSLYPRNLLGAMYLQFYWLLTSAAELSRCLECGRIIPHSPPMPGSGRVRKTYRNKKFCDDRCRQKYHYHNVIKPKRNAERNDGND